MSDKPTSINGLIHNEAEILSSLGKLGFEKERYDAYKTWKNTEAPTSRDEYWKYTRVGPALKKSYSITENEEPFNNEFLRSIDAYNLVFVNGVFDASSSDSISEKGIHISDLQTAKNTFPEQFQKLNSDREDRDYFSLLNDSFFTNGPFILLEKNTEIQKPIRVVHVSNGKDRLINVKGLYIGETGSSAQIIETWDQDDADENLMNARLDITLRANARLDWVKIQSIGENNLIDQGFVSQERDSHFTMHTISTDGALIRNNLTITLNGENAESNMNGLYLGRGKEHIDNHTTIHHRVPNCLSNELYKGIVNDNAKAVFNGKVVVHRDAQKTNAFQSNANILLTDTAEIYSKPELEIYADDVKCSHGSTTGQLDEEALFYLQSRGIDKEKSRNLLLFAFAREVLDKIQQKDLRKKIIDYLGERYQVNAND